MKPWCNGAWYVRRLNALWVYVEKDERDDGACWLCVCVCVCGVWSGVISVTISTNVQRCCNVTAFLFQQGICMHSQHNFQDHIQKKKSQAHKLIWYQYSYNNILKIFFFKDQHSAVTEKSSCDAIKRDSSGLLTVGCVMYIGRKQSSVPL